MPAFRMIALAVTLVLVPTIAWGKCDERRLRGAYRFFATTHTLEDTVWTVCDVRVERDGTVEPDAPCLQRNLAGHEIESVVDSGTLSVARSCDVTGSLTIAGSESIILNAIMSYDTRIIEGIGVNPDDSTFRFSAVRQR